ncbi:MAG: Cytochrome c oxidase polypeptide 5, mitochondrial [Sarea resinae]|nr:MAG: Cytochrome c oxidase polypeptide 5, mitochondrial [Sarea resinae]
MFRSSITRVGGSAALVSRQAALRASKPSLAVCANQARQAHAVSNPTLADIEKRWEVMPPQEQADLWMALRDRMKTDWHELTLQEKKAAYWIAFGPHGPRAQSAPGEGWKIAGYTLAGVSFALFLTWLSRLGAKPGPSTMTKEYQEKSNEYLKAQNVEPITGISAPGYTGAGQVQSRPAKS